MNYKLYIYVFVILLSTYATTCLNIEKFIRSGKVIESKIFIFLISIVLGYLFANFIFDFLEISKII